MVLIFGGVYQGKLDYALKHFGLTQDDVCFCVETDPDAPIGRKIVYEIDKWILALLKSDKDVADSINKFISNNPDAIIICNDISCGVVPIDPIMRRLREEVGRALGVITQNSDEVIRVYCGIASRLK